MPIIFIDEKVVVLIFLPIDDAILYGIGTPSGHNFLPVA